MATLKEMVLLAIDVALGEAAPDAMMTAQLRRIRKRVRTAAAVVLLRPKRLPRRARESAARKKMPPGKEESSSS